MASPELEFLDEEAGHNRFTRARVVGEQEAQSRLWQHLKIDRLDLVGQSADAGQTDRELAIISVGEMDTGRLNQESQPFRIRRLSRCFLLYAGNDCGLFRGDDGLLKLAIGQSDAALVTGRSVRTEGSDIFQGDGYVEMSFEKYSLSDLC